MTPYSEQQIDWAFDRLDAKAAAQKAARAPSPAKKEGLMPPKSEWHWLDYIVAAVQYGVLLVLFVPLIPVLLLAFILGHLFRWDEFSLTLDGLEDRQMDESNRRRQRAGRHYG